jgi:hexosaminidase
MQTFNIPVESLLTRSNAQLQVCDATGSVLRMEDDGPFRGARARFNIAIMQPCWRWDDAPLRGITNIEVRAGRLPYIFNQSAKENAARKFLSAKTAHGELVIQRDTCDGETIATVALPEKPDADGFVTLHAALPSAAATPATLCIRFSGDFRPDMWVLDRITLVPAH